jgi:hypothetical protein
LKNSIFRNRTMASWIWTAQNSVMLGTYNYVLTEENWKPSRLPVDTAVPKIRVGIHFSSLWAFVIFGHQ